MNSNWRGCLLEILETIVLTLVIFFVVQTFVAQPYQIIGVSMESTLENGQYVLVDKISPHFSDYKRGDVIVLQPPAGVDENNGSNVPFIKRVVGVGGDTVEVKDGAVWVNGAKLTEPYVYEGQETIPLTSQSFWQVLGGLAAVRADPRVDRHRPGLAAVLGRALWFRPARHV
jgi:signal peptidase I